jgi:hypothetical protein
MSKLTLADLCVVIPLLEKELDRIHHDIEQGNQQESDEASELSVVYAATAAKFEQLYKSLWEEGSNYPCYDDLIKR